MCFHSNFRIALYNLFMHSLLTNQKRVIVLKYIITENMTVKIFFF